MTTMQLEAIEDLKRGFEGEILLPADGGYDGARRIWNAMIDKRPAVIARCATTTDVVRAVSFARDNGLVLAVRGGGHNIAGSALCDDGLVIDLTRMKAASVDAAKRRVVVEGGATLADLDAATLPHGLATPVGINSTTGIAGLTLGVRASANEHPDLFWALKGGSGNFGVVTRFEFRLHPVGPDVLSGLIVYPLSQAKSVLRQYREFVASAPEELSVWAVLRKAPPLPFLPESVHGQGIIALALIYAGDPKQGERLVGPLRKFGTPVGEHVGVQPYVAWQQVFDPLLTEGARNYWKSHNLSQLDDGVLDTIVAFADVLPSPVSEIFLASIGGATARPAPGAAAYAHRDAEFVLNVHGRWDDPANDGPGIAWARAFFKAAAPYATGGTYVNFMTADEGDRVRAAYGPNYDRLARVKRAYDPDNLFRTNQNIEPA
jgi:FAD/FMN-containing dehydrogenase